MDFTGTATVKKYHRGVWPVRKGGAGKVVLIRRDYAPMYDSKDLNPIHADFQLRASRLDCRPPQPRKPTGDMPEEEIFK